MTKTDEKNFWPHAIVGLIIFGVILGVWTIKETMKYPVEMDNSYMLNYHKVDANINEILKNQKIFDKNYDLNLLSKKIAVGKNRFEIIIKDKNGNFIKNAKVNILVTRPETTKYDKKIEAENIDGKYVAEFNLNKEGRWNFIVKTKIGKITGYKTYKLSTLK